MCLRNLLTSLVLTSLGIGAARAQAPLVVDEVKYAPIGRLEVKVRPDLSKEDASGNVELMVTLSNHSADTLRYVSMSCSYDDMFELDPGMPYTITVFPCGKNVPRVRTIAPQDTVFVEIMLAPVGGVKPTKPIASKIGFWFVDADVHHDISDAYAHRIVRGTLLWSAEEYDDFMQN